VTENVTQPPPGRADGRDAGDEENESRLSALLTVLASWRDWNLPVKLAAVTVVPIVFAVVLGAMQIADQVERADSYEQVDRLVVANEQLRSLVNALQQERSASVVLRAADTPDIAVQAQRQRVAVDSARREFVDATGRATIDHAVTAARYADALTWLDELPDVRAQVAANQIDAATTLSRYTDIVSALLRFDRAMSSESLDPDLVATSSALYDLEAIKEEVQYQHAVVSIGLVRGGLFDGDLAVLRDSQARLADRTADFNAVVGTAVSGDYDRAVSGEAVDNRNAIVKSITDLPAGTLIPVDHAAWNDVSQLTANRVDRVATMLGAELRSRSAMLQDQASDGAGLAAVVLLVALVVALAVMIVIGRHLLRSLSALRRGALEVAERTLPAAVERIRDRGDAAEPFQVQPVEVTSMDEVGQVAKAFDKVQHQALRLATEQAGLRAKYSSVFVNLSRRSQGLVQRQLQLLERLERDEEDADQLATLFQLDHLATRMRRNNENLMVLSGSDVGRRNQRPTALADLLRAAVSEVEQYQRVVMLPPPNVRILGYAVGDMVRLTAELLDNATAFSAPDTQVTIASHSFEDGSVCVAVLDEGIGMTQAELDEANAKLADSGSIDVSTSRRMGLFVIGRLSARHGVEVRLNGGQDSSGVRATVTVPVELVASAATDTATSKDPTITPPSSGLRPYSPNSAAPAGQTNGSAVNGHGSNGTTVSPSLSSSLPRRQPTNGVPPIESTSDIMRRLDDLDPPVDDAPVNDAPADGDRLPLPRRSPGRGPLVGPPGPRDIARPRPPFSTPPSQARDAGLFTPTDGGDDGWWSTAPTAEQRQAAIEETTPIFDEMISAWFRAADTPATPPEESTSDDTAPEPAADEKSDDAWQFAADAGFDTARAVSRAEPSEFTENGLPRRSPRKNLVPGSAGSDTPSGEPRHGRAAEDVRERLSSYRHGVRRARGHRQDADEGALPAAPPRPDNPLPEPETPAGPESATPTVSIEDSTETTAQLDLSGAGWRFAADVGWRAANAVSTSTPVDFTSGGLPRRTPRGNLVPGSVEEAGGAMPPAARADGAEELRSRLGNFQKGLSRGRRSLAERSSGTGHPDSYQQESE
jgi:signal transduction histidine kinase